MVAGTVGPLSTLTPWAPVSFITRQAAA